MLRYLGQPLKENPRVAVVTNDNLGNFVIATPLMQMLKNRHGGQLDYYGGARVSELAERSEFVDAAYPLHGAEPRQTARDMSERTYDLVVNIEWTPWAKAATSILAGRDTFVCGPCIGPDGRGDFAFPEDETGRLWNDQDWMAEDVVQKYQCLGSGYIAEIFCRLAYLEGTIPRYKLPRATPPIKLPDILVSGTASLPEKLWPLENWRRVIEQLASMGLTVGLLGAKPTVQGQFWKGASDEDRFIDFGVEDLRGRLTLPEVVGAIESVRLVVTLDNGILHLSSATGTPVIGLFREGIHRLWAPPHPEVTVLHPGPGAPVAAIGVEDVVSAVKSVLA